MAKTLADIRAEYPQYDRFDDKTLADALYNKHYSHADRREFDARIGLNPYDNPLEVAGKALAGTPGNIMTGISGLTQMFGEGEAGNPNKVLDVIGPDFKTSDVPVGGTDLMNFGGWVSNQMGIDPHVRLTKDELENYARQPGVREKYAAYLRTVGTDAQPEDVRYIGTAPTTVAKAELKGQLERQDYAKGIPQIDAAPGSVESILGNAVGSVAQMAPGYAATILTRNPLPTVALAQALTSGQSYADARDAGVDPRKAAEYAVSNGFAEAVGEALPLGAVLKEGGKILPKLFKAGVSEAAQETVTQFIQSMLESGTVTPDMTWGDVKDQVISAAATGALAGGVLTAGESAVEAARKRDKKAAEVSDQVFGDVVTADVADTPAVEDQMALPAPATLLALPAPDAPPVVARRQPAAPAQTEMVKAPEQEVDYQAQVALRKTRQAETAALLQTARETVQPLGSFTRDEVDAAVLPKPTTRTVNGRAQVKYGENGQYHDATVDPTTGIITSPGADADMRRATGMSPTQRVMTWRAQTGRNMDTPITVEDMARAKVPQSIIDAVITARRPMTQGQVVVPKDIRAIADAKNIIADDGAFSELAFRTTGQRNIERMSQAQLSVLKSTIESLPSHENRVTLPIADAPAFDEGQYNKSLDAIRNQGRFTLGAIKDAAGVKDDKIARSIRDAMVRRGQLVQRGKNDFRLYDVLGQERQAVPDDLPAGAFSEYVVKKAPVNRIQIKVDGKSIGTFGSGTEARNKIRELRRNEAEKGGTPAKIELGQAEESAYAVMENRYDENGTLLGQVAVDTSRDETAARKLANERNNPDTGARYTQTVVTPDDKTLTPAEAAELSTAGAVVTADADGNLLVTREDIPATRDERGGLRADPNGTDVIPGFKGKFTKTMRNTDGQTVQVRTVAEYRAAKGTAQPATQPAPKPKPKRGPAPAALAGRTDEVVSKLNAMAKERGLPLLGTKVNVADVVKSPSGEAVRGMFLNNVISITAGTLEPNLTTDQVVDRLAQVMDHELIHALKRAGVLAPETAAWKTLSKYVSKTTRPDTGETYLQFAKRLYADAPGYNTEEDMVEEAIAEAFRVWAGNRRNVVGQPATAFRQLVEWFKRLFSALPDDIFSAIESGAMVREALTPPGAGQPRAVAAEEMAAARKDVAVAQAAKDENAVRVASRAFLRARDQAREDRLGRAGPKTVIGTTPSRAFAASAPVPRDVVDGIVNKYRASAGISTKGLATLLPEDIGYLTRVADAQQRAVHDPSDNAVAKAYRALTTETRSMFDALGITDVARWTEDGQPYASVDEMFADMAAGRLKLRLSADMFGEGADNPGHPMYKASGVKAADGTPLVFNDLFRVVHDVYGRAPIGLKRDSGRDDYNAYHEHARLVSDDARKALATETLAQGAWHHYGPHLRRKDGTVPRERDVDYLAPERKEFAEQKAFLLPDDLIAADPGWALADKADAAVDPEAVIDTAREEPKFSLYDEHLPGGRLYGNAKRSPGGAVSAPDTAPPAFSKQRDGNQFFGGDMAAEQLRMAQTGERGTTMLYLSPDEFLALASQPVNPEQTIYDGLAAGGYKFNTLPSLVIDGYAGKVRAVDADGAYAVAALAGRAERIPVAIYPKRGENLGLVSAIDANGSSVPWPADGRAENYLDARGEEPKYMVTAPYGDRVPREHLNIIDQRVEGWVGSRLAKLGRSKRELPLPKGVKEAVGGTIFDMRVKFQDRMLSVKEMIENVQAMGGEVTDKTDVYMAEQLAGSRTVQEVEHREGTLYEPLFAALEREGKADKPIAAKDLEDFLYARHAPERNAYLRAAGSKVANPSGMSDAEAEAILDKAALDGKLDRFEQLAAMVDAITANTTATRVANGLISQDSADQSPYQYYVPLRGKDQEDLDPDDIYDRPARARSGKGYTVGGKEDRSAVGRSRKAGDILASVMLQNTESVIRSEKNRVALSFMRLLQANPNTGFGTILSSAPTRMVRGADGQIREAGDPSFRQQPDIFTAKWKGKEIVARVEDPRVARAMRADYVQVGGEPSILDKFVAGAGRLNRYLATVNTSLNPEFLISNVARDAQTAAILGAQYDIKSFSRKIITGAPAAVLAIREVLRDGTASTPLAERFQEMQKAGGTTEFLGIHDLDTHIKRLRGDAARTGWQPTARQAFNRIQTIGKFIDDYNKVAENAFRLGAYNEARNAGVSIDRAAFLAKNLTVNFNKGGEQKALMNSLYLFYNASISGTFVLLNGLKNKRVQKIVAGVVVAGIVMDALNRAMSGDDDDNGIKDYDDIPDYVLETNWVFMIPGSKEYVSIPMPYGFNFFHNLGRNLSNAVSGSPAHSPGKSAMSTLMTAINAFNPIGGANSPLNFIAPTFADPLVDLATNTDFAGNAIVPERPTFGLDVPDSQKFWANTGEIPKWTAEQLNRLTGGNEVRPGAVDVSPEVLQFWIDYATGATGKFITRNVGLGQNVVTGNFEDIKIGDIPFARRVVGSVTNRGNTERYYENATEIKTVAEELDLAQETGDVDMVNRLLTDKAAEVGLAETFKKAEKNLSDMRKQIRELKADDVLPGAQKREMIRLLEEQQDEIMAGLNRLYYETKGFALPPR